VAVTLPTNNATRRMMDCLIALFSSFGQLQTERTFEVVFLYLLIFVVQFVMTLPPVLQVLATVRVAPRRRFRT
jgi:hypothetical protein